MPNEFIARNGIISKGNVVVTGSVTATGGIITSGSLIHTGSLNISGSVVVTGSITSTDYIQPQYIASSASVVVMKPIGGSQYTTDFSTGGAGDLRFYYGGGGGWSFNWYTNNIKRVTIGDGGLTVTGSAIVKGTGTTSATTSLLVQNSAGSTAFQIQDNLGTIFPGKGQDSSGVYIGRNVAASWTNSAGSTVIGDAADVDGNAINQVIVGKEAKGVSSGNVNIGYRAGLNGSSNGNGILIGYNAGQHGASTYPTRPIGIGDSVAIYGSEGIAIGTQAYAIGNSVAIGGLSGTPTAAGYGGTQAIAIGYSAKADTTGLNSTGSALAIGSYASASAEEVVIGSPSFPFTNVYFGSGKTRSAGLTSGSGVSYTINGAGAFGTDFAGGNLTLAGGKGTGTGSAADVIFATATTGSTGTTLQSLTNRVWIKGQTGNVGIGTSNPNYTLDVSGSSEFVGNMLITGSVIASGSLFRVNAATASFIGSSSIGPYFTIAPTIAGTGPAYQNLIAAQINPSFTQSATFGVYTTALQTTRGDIELLEGGAVVVAGTAGSGNDATVPFLVQGYRDAGYNNNIFLSAKSGSVGIGAAVNGVGGAGSGGLLNPSYGNPRNVLIGAGAGSTGNFIDNVVIGYKAFIPGNISNSGNVIIGSQAVGNGATGAVNNNVILGYQAFYTPGRGGSGRANTVAIGYQANYSGSDSGVYIGYQAGLIETGSGKLYIANTSTSTPLIGGDFTNARLGVNINPSSTSATLHVKGTGATSSTTALLVQNSNASSSLTVRDDTAIIIGGSTTSNNLNFATSTQNAGQHAINYSFYTSNNFPVRLVATAIGASGIGYLEVWATSSDGGTATSANSVFRFGNGGAQNPNNISYLPLSIGATTISGSSSGQIMSVRTDQASADLSTLTLQAGNANFVNRAGGNLILSAGAAAGSGDGTNGYIAFRTTNTTASAGVTNSTSEVARFSLGKNLLIGTTTDPGYKLNVSGSGNFTGDLTVTGSFTVVTGSTVEFQVNQTGVKIGNATTDSHSITGSVSISSSASTSGSALTVYKSGSTVVDIQGSQGQLFSVIDSLTGSLMSVNDVSGLPILEVFSNDTVVMGTYGAPGLTVSGSTVAISASLLSTVQTGSLPTGSNLIYTVNTGSYTAGFFDYYVTSGSNYRAGNIMAVWGASSIKFTDLATPDIGSTVNLQFSMSLSASSAQLFASASSAGWTVKTLFRTI